jgi:hypothetical protein
VVNVTVASRRQVLDEVEDCVCRDRQATHGDPEDNFADIALMASTILRRKLKEDVSLDELDVAMFMVCLKLVRAGRNPSHYDNFIDLCWVRNDCRRDPQRAGGGVSGHTATSLAATLLADSPPARKDDDMAGAWPAHAARGLRRDQPGQGEARG